MSTSHDTFPTATTGLPEARRAHDVELRDGGTFDLHISPVVKRIASGDVRMLAYNGSVPGPTLRVKQGSEVEVNITNDGDHETTVHWHGLRLENRYDGTHETQELIPVGGSYTARISFPDPGAYWFHPHVREDYGQEMGLYGNVIVEPVDADYWPPVHRDLVITLDDVLIEDGQIASFSRTETTHSAMGRFGNVLLAAGEDQLTIDAHSGEVVRLYLTNTANTRVFRVQLPGARMKLVGGDSGRYECEQFVDDVTLAPSERAVVDVLFQQPGRYDLEHRTPERTYRLAAIQVSHETSSPPLAAPFEELRRDPELTAERDRLAADLEREPDKKLAFIAEMDMPAPEGDGPVVYTCPMHPDVVSENPGHCPECGMKLLASQAPASYMCPMHLEVLSEEPGHCPKCGMKLLPAAMVAAAGAGHGDGGDLAHAHERHENHVHESHAHNGHEGSHDHAGSDGIEWEDDMVEVNRLTTPANMRWKLIDRDTGAENHAIVWKFRVGDRVKIRLLNEMAGDHPMHHPFHVHGAGRFLIIARNGEPEQNLVWKDTVLARTGETVDILLEVTNAGRWMAHCHIAEHHESGMMFSFDVEPTGS